MRSKLLEATAICKNNNEISIVNTAMDIEVDWDCTLVKNDFQAEVDIIISSVRGNFSTQTKVDSVETTTIVKFKTDESWKILYDKTETTLPLFPSTAIINLSSKKIKIRF